MKYSFKRSEIENMVLEEVKRHLSEQEAEYKAAPGTNYAFAVVANAPGSTSHIAELKAVRAEDAIKAAGEWTKKGYTLDQKSTSKEVLQQTGQNPDLDNPDLLPQSDPPDMAAEEKIDEMRGDLKYDFERLLQHLGPEKFLNDFLKLNNPRSTSAAIEEMLKLYQLRENKKK